MTAWRGATATGPPTLSASWTARSTATTADAIERLEERIAELEARRERMKTINRIVRAALKRGGGKLMPGAFDELGLSTKERADLLSAAGNTFEPFKGYPSYALSNLGGNISRQRQRLARLRSAAALAQS